jgi:hypothetical protein
LYGCAQFVLGGVGGLAGADDAPEVGGVAGVGGIGWFAVEPDVDFLGGRFFLGAHLD